MWLGTMTTVQLKLLRKAFPLQAVCVVLLLFSFVMKKICNFGKKESFFDMENGGDWEKS